MQICFINYFVLSSKKTVFGSFQKISINSIFTKRYETLLLTGKSASYHSVIFFYSNLRLDGYSFITTNPCRPDNTGSIYQLLPYVYAIRHLRTRNHIHNRIRKYIFWNNILNNGFPPPIHR